jgi:threonine dehydratase
MISKFQHQMPDITAQTLRAAAVRVQPYIHETPVLTSRTIDNMTEAQCFFKCENFQKVGAFKARGAVNAVMQLPDNVRAVATHSSGNHGQALAWAAAQRNLQAYIVMPENAPDVKKAAVAGYGATIITCAPTLEAREQTLQQVVADTGAHFVHPYDDPHVIAGQATCAMELLQQIPELDHIIAPVGGGGLLSGTALAAHYFGRGISVFAGEPEGANDAWQSFRAGARIPLKKAHTVADGLRTSLGHLTFPVIMNLVSEIFTVSDAEILSAQRLIIERMKIVIEPSCAVPLAALLRHPNPFKGKRVGVILTGGNADLSALGRL